MDMSKITSNLLDLVNLGMKNRTIQGENFYVGRGVLDRNEDMGNNYQ